MHGVAVHINSVKISGGMATQDTCFWNGMQFFYCCW